LKSIKSYDEFKEIIKSDLSIVIAKTKNCVVCNPITVKLENFMNDYPEVPVYQIYLEDVEIFSGQHLVFTVPTIIIFNEGNEILRESRFINFSNIQRLLDIYLEK
jgi:hypothetical protein